jgi:alanyl-tRNA synthetase
MLDPVATNTQIRSTSTVGQAFLQHYAGEGFKPVPGSSLLDDSVPMSFVMSAGLVQVETSARQHKGPLGDRYALVQNCFRHFDLDQIGESDLHLSLFRMPGAFLFGPVDREAAIARTWRLLTGVYGLPVDRLWVTCFSGDLVAGHRFEADREARDAWLGLGLPVERIVGLGAGHNFWKQGASVVGEEHVPKCGPNTEVFFDRGAHRACGPGCKPGCSCGRFVEFLNMLFITWHIEDKAGIVRPLEAPFTETVLGAERVAMLLQGAPSAFEIDSIRPLVEEVRRIAHATSIPAADRWRQERVLVDHLRALLFLTADGAPPPGRGGRAYLMRRLTRGVLTAQRLLAFPEIGAIDSLLHVALGLYAQDHPQVFRAQMLLRDCFSEEHAHFQRTLERGQRHLDRLLKRRGDGRISGEEMVEFEKQHGVPEPLLEMILRERQIQYSRDAYRAAYRRGRQAPVGAS